MHDCISLASDVCPDGTFFLKSQRRIFKEHLYNPLLLASSVYQYVLPWLRFPLWEWCRYVESINGFLTTYVGMWDDVYEKRVLSHRVLYFLVSATPIPLLNEVLMPQLIRSDQGSSGCGFDGPQTRRGGDIFMFCGISCVTHFRNTFTRPSRIMYNHSIFCTQRETWKYSASCAFLFEYRELDYYSILLL